MTRAEGKPSRLGLIAVSFLWAVALWYYAAEEMSAERDIAAAVAIIAPSGCFVHVQGPAGDGGEPSIGPGKATGEVPVRVTVKGPRGKVAGLVAGDVAGRVVIEPGIPPGPLTLTLSTAFFTVARHPDLKVVSVQPSSVSLFLSEARTKAVSVRVMPEGAPAKGFFISDRPRVVPEQVEVSAAPDVLEKIDFIETEPVNVGGRDRSFTVDVRLKKTFVLGSQNRDVFLQADRVIVFMPIGQEPVEHEVTEVPVSVLLPPNADFRAVPAVKTLSVRVRGTEARVATASAGDIKIFVDASSLTDVKQEADVVLPVRVVSADDIRVLAGSAPATMTVRIVPRRIGPVPP